MVDHAAQTGSPKWGPHPRFWAPISSAQEGQNLPSTPTTGHGWCSYGLLMVPASSKHGGSHWARGADATGACLHACMGVVHVCVRPVHPNAMEVHSMAWHGMGCECGARAIHERAVRGRKQGLCVNYQRLL